MAFSCLKFKNLLYLLLKDSCIICILFSCCIQPLLVLVAVRILPGDLACSSRAIIGMALQANKEPYLNVVPNMILFIIIYNWFYKYYFEPLYAQLRFYLLGWEEVSLPLHPQHSWFIDIHKIINYTPEFKLCLFTSHSVVIMNALAVQNPCHKYDLERRTMINICRQYLTIMIIIILTFCVCVCYIQLTPIRIAVCIV